MLIRLRVDVWKPAVLCVFCGTWSWLFLGGGAIIMCMLIDDLTFSSDSIYVADISVWPEF